LLWVQTEGIPKIGPGIANLPGRLSIITRQANACIEVHFRDLHAICHAFHGETHFGCFEQVIVGLQQTEHPNLVHALH